MNNVKFVVVCTFGAGSSLMLRMNIEKVLKGLNVTNATVEVSDMGSAKGKQNVTAYLCSTVLQPNLQAQIPDTKVVGIKNFYDQKELLEAVKPFVDEQ